MQHLEVSCAVRPIEWPLGVKWLSIRGFMISSLRCKTGYLNDFSWPLSVPP